MADTVTYPLGSLVNVRGREWVVEPCDLKDCIKLRPLGGTDDETQVIMPSIEDTELRSAVFPAPNTTDIGRFESAKLLRDALKLKLTNAAGPFRRRLLRAPARDPRGGEDGRNAVRGGSAA